MEECDKDTLFYYVNRKRHNPNDKMRYNIPIDVITYTENVLLEYSNMNPANEGMVYWCGIKENGIMNTSMVIAPKTESNSGRVSVSNRANFDVIGLLSEYNLIQIGQVHSHPGNWVDHSYGDDNMAAFKIEGLLSIVVPIYGVHGMRPLWMCGIHRYTNNNFIRLSNRYIKKHIIINDSITDVVFKDLRI